MFVLSLPFSAHWALATPPPRLLALYAVPTVQASDVALGMLLLFGAGRWVWRWATQQPRKPLPPEHWWLTFPVLGLCALAWLSVPMALRPPLAAYTALRWSLAASVYFWWLHSGVDWEWLSKCFLLGLCGQVLVGVGQVLAQGPLGLPGELALSAREVGASIVLVGNTAWLRAYGLTFHPNVLGGFLAVGLIVALPQLKARRWRVVWVWLWLGLLLTFSRAAWLASAIGVSAVGLWLFFRAAGYRRALTFTALGAGAVLLMLAALLAQQFTVRFTPALSEAETRSINERGILAAVALETITEHWSTGIGAGNFSLAVDNARATVVPQPVHHVTLLLAAEVGVLGGLLWFGLWLNPSRWLSAMAQRQAWLSVALLIAWLSLGVVGLWDFYPWGLDSGRLLSATLLGLIAQRLQ